jgi:hypothetical protein
VTSRAGPKVALAGTDKSFAGSRSWLPVFCWVFLDDFAGLR